MELEDSFMSTQEAPGQNFPISTDTVKPTMAPSAQGAGCRQMSPSDDALLEYLIGHCYAQMMRAADEAQQRYWCARLTRWVAQRSPERVQQMEREQGLI